MLPLLWTISLRAYIYFVKIDLGMSYHLLGNRGPSLDNVPTYTSQFPPHNTFQSNPPQTTSIALFHIPSDATNSLYIDGIPNDATEREVSRKS